MELHLTVITPENKTQKFVVKNQESSIGRDPDCDICLNDINVSGYHARIVKKDNSFWIEDGYENQPSRNGTWLSNKRVDTPAILNEGDVLLIGTCRLLITDIHVPTPGDTEEIALLRNKNLLSMEDFQKMQLAEIEATRHRRKGLIIAGVSVLLVLGILIFRQSQNSEALPVVVEKAGPKKSKNILFSSFALPGKSFTFSAPIAGKVEKILKSNKGYVNKGDVIARLDQTEQKSSFHRAKAFLETEKLRVEETKNKLSALEKVVTVTSLQLQEKESQVKKYSLLHQKGKISYEILADHKKAHRETLEKLKKLQETYVNYEKLLAIKKNELKIANSKYEMAGWKLQETIITSPISGYISDLPIVEGTYLRRGSAICRIIDISNIKICLFVPYEEYPGWREQQKIDVIFPQIIYPNHFQGIILSIAFRSESDSPISEIIIDVPNPEETIKPGMKSEIHYTKVIESSNLLISSKCLLRRDPQYVFVVKEGECYLRTVEIEKEKDGYIFVKSGLKKGEQVVVSPDLHLQDGKAVKIVEVLP